MTAILLRPRFILQWLILIDVLGVFREEAKGNCRSERAKRYVGYTHRELHVLCPSQVLTDMPTTTEESQTSDNDGGERPVRRKLKETSITSVPQNANPTGTDSRASSRGRKRSFDEEEPDNEDESAHRRKRSRSSNIEEDENGEKPTTPTDTERKEADAAAAENASSKLMSPRRKRSRDQLDKTEAAADKKGDKEAAENEPSTEKTTAEGEPEKKRHRDDPENKEKVSCTHPLGRQTR